MIGEQTTSDHVDESKATFRGLMLDLVRPDDLPALYELFVGAGDGPSRWRFRGATPSYEQFPQALWQHVYSHFLVRRVSTQEVVGYVSAYSANAQDGHCYISFIAVPSARKSGSMILGFVLFIDFLFRNAPFRKLYAEAAASNFAQYESAVSRGIFAVEGCLKNHEWHRGALEDLFLLACTRSGWSEWRCHFGLSGPFSATIDAGDGDR